MKFKNNYFQLSNTNNGYYIFTKFVCFCFLKRKQTERDCQEKQKRNHKSNIIFNLTRFFLIFTLNIIYETIILNYLF